MSVKRLGSCLCQKVRFTVTGNPYSYAVCHCSNCKKSAGSAFMTNAFFNPANVAVTEGQEFVRQYQDKATTRGETITRSFCSQCGSSLFLSSPTKTDWITVCPTAVDDPHEWVPRRESFPDSKFPWVTALHIEAKPKPKL
ncbi:Mss4-like protein [Roridomyces roridus]|uniref:Mss4-like protein n=1 Tax=Roridomyces roridus TaxID=1738132 RepID=A0AAD7BME6_9AGAR|nr:Mss4-like protein [Roridomyces roridus]